MTRAILVSALALFACARPAPAWSDKGAPHLEVVVLRGADGYHATATLNGDLTMAGKDKDGKRVRVNDPAYMCPAVIWSCETEQGFKLRGSGHIVQPCDLPSPQRTFAWDYTVSEPCRARLSLEPTNGKRPLVGRGPTPPQWEGR